MTEKRNTTTQDPLDETVAAALDPAEDAGPSQIERERDELKDRLLRSAAEFDNYRKRTERERQTMLDSITADVVEDLLPLIDDLERALRAEPGPDGVDAYRRGVELIHKGLDDLLRKRGVKPIEAIGADFDPRYHHAVAYEDAEGRRDGEIIEEFRRGYVLGDRLVRPSMVKVAKG